MHKYGESKMTQIMMATVCHVIAWAGRMKYQAAWFLLNRVYHILQTHEHLHTAGHRYKQENLSLYGKEACQPSTHIAWKVHVWRAFRVSTNKPLCAFHTENKTSPFLFKINNGQMTGLSSHLQDCLVQDLNHGLWSVMVDR